MLKGQWVNEEAAEKRMHAQKFALDRQRNQDAIAFNETERQLHTQAKHEDKNRDKDMLSLALEREAAIRQIEVEELARRRTETLELQKFYKEQKGAKAAGEQALEQLVAVENDKIWSKQEAQWRREDQARINLLKNVYQNREADIELKKLKKNDA